MKVVIIGGVAAGPRNVKVLDGGVAMWPYEKEM
jgi:hypothetical protein